METAADALASFLDIQFGKRRCLKQAVWLMKYHIDYVTFKSTFGPNWTFTRRVMILHFPLLPSAHGEDQEGLGLGFPPSEPRDLARLLPGLEPFSRGTVN